MSGRTQFWASDKVFVKARCYTFDELPVQGTHGGAVVCVCVANLRVREERADGHESASWLLSRLKC